MSDATSMAENFASRRCDPVQVLEQALERAGQVAGVFISMTAERARAEAEAAAARWRAGCPLSPFDGVPVAWKDLFDVAGTITTAGADYRRKAPAALRDASCVARLSRLGMVCVGKTNLSELAYSGLGLNPHFGTPHNPHGRDQPRIPGGSSSGSAVAVASMIVPIAMGTDTAGSIRLPAALNGVVGYRSSCHRYSRDNVFPLAQTLDSLGPITHSVRDTITLDEMLTGRPPVHTRRSVEGLRCVLDTRLLDDARIEPAVQGNLLRAVERLKDEGVLVEERPCVPFHAALDLIKQQGWLGAFEAFALHEALLDGEDAQRLDPRVRRRLESARHLPASQLVRLYQARLRLQAQLVDDLDGAFLITPTVAHVAPPLAALEADDQLFIETNLATLRLTMPGSLLDMPGISLPSGTDAAGLPTALLLSAPMGEDPRLLEAALRVERVLRR